MPETNQVARDDEDAAITIGDCIGDDRPIASAEVVEPVVAGPARRQSTGVQYVRESRLGVVSGGEKDTASPIGRQRERNWSARVRHNGRVDLVPVRSPRRQGAAGGEQQRECECPTGDAEGNETHEVHCGAPVRMKTGGGGIRTGSQEPWSCLRGRGARAQMNTVEL